MAKTLRNANGFGSVYYLGKRRRKPYAVRITTGWEIIEGKEKQIRKILGYFETKKEAQKFLFDYNDNKYNINYLNYTFKFNCWLYVIYKLVISIILSVFIYS